jgi:hypothetical protein
MPGNAIADVFQFMDDSQHGEFVAAGELMQPLPKEFFIPLAAFVVWQLDGGDDLPAGVDRRVSKPNSE